MGSSGNKNETINNHNFTLDLIGGGIGFVDGILNYLLTLLVLHGRINQQIPGGTRSE